MNNKRQSGDMEESYLKYTSTNLERDRLEAERYFDLFQKRSEDFMLNFITRCLGGREQIGIEDVHDLHVQWLLKISMTHPECGGSPYDPQRGGRFTGWLCRIGFNVIRDNLRKSRRTLPTTSLDSQNGDGEEEGHSEIQVPDPQANTEKQVLEEIEEEIERGELEGLLNKLRSLDGEAYRVLQDVIFDGLIYKKCANRHGRGNSEAWVYRQLTNALVLLLHLRGFGLEEIPNLLAYIKQGKSGGRGISIEEVEGILKKYAEKLQNADTGGERHATTTA